MSWLSEFEDELVIRGVRRGVRQRLVTELADHLACEPALEPRIALTRLGAAREIADQCADELATDDARRIAFGSLAALAMTALAMLGSLALLGRLHYPGFDNGFSAVLAVPAIIAIVFGSQVAFVAGSLAAWRAVRRRGEAVLPGAEVALLRRRARVALAAGTTVAGGLVAYIVNDIEVLPAWWLAIGGSLVAVAAVALVGGWRGVARSGSTVTLAAGPAGDIFDDIPPLRPLRGHPLALCVLVAAFCALAMTLVEWHVERSLTEGLQRGAVEAIGFVLCFATLGRAVGARR